MLKRLKGLLSKSPLEEADVPYLQQSGSETKEDSTANPILHAFANSKIWHWLTYSGYEQLTPRLELAYQEAARVLYQALPIRIYAYDLELPMGVFEFQSAFEGQRPANTIIEAATVIKDGKKLGYFLYSLEPLHTIPSVSDDVSGLGSYSVIDDWERLLHYSEHHDLAYAIDWLRKLYGKAIITLTKVLVGGEQPTLDFADGMNYLNDSTMHEWLDRFKDKLAGQEGAKDFNKAVDKYIQASARASKKPLRENPLIAALFAFHSPIFRSISIESFRELCLSSFDRLQISGSDIGVCTDFFNYVVDYDLIAAHELAQISYWAATGAGEKELIAYAACNVGVALTPSDKLEDLKLGIKYLKEARSLFHAIDTQHTALGAIELNLKRFTGRLAGMGKSDQPTEVGSKDIDETLSAYNKKIVARDLVGALEVLDNTLKDVDRNDSSWIDLNALAGETLLSRDRIDDAYGRLYRCENSISDGNTSSEGHYETFKTALLLRSGESGKAIRTAEDAISRLNHLCSFEVLRSLIITLSASYTENGDPDSAITLIKKYENSFGLEEDLLFLQANFAFAHLAKGNFEQVVSICEDLFKSLDETQNLSLKFDICKHFADAKVSLYRDQKTDFQSALAAFDGAEKYLADIDNIKQSLFYRSKAKLLELQGRAAGDPTSLFEQGFAASEKAFHEVARQPGDVNDRIRLLSGLKRKVVSFPTYSRLFDIYTEAAEWRKLYTFCQRFKGTFLIEAYFSNSENMVAKKGAKWLADSLKGNETGALNQLTVISAMIRAGGPGKLREFLQNYLIEQRMIDGSDSVLPVSVEHLEPGLGLICLENLQRHQEVSKSITLEFLESQLRHDVAVVEFFPLKESDSVGALIIQKGAEPQFPGKYEKPEELSPNTFFEHEKIDAGKLTTNNTAFQSAFGRLGSEIVARLRNDITEIVFCPTSWITNLPLHALQIGDGKKCIADMYKCIYNASANLYALSVARTRAKSRGGIGIIDPHSELFYSNHEAAILSSNSAIEFNNIFRGPLTWDELRNSTAGASWIHLSAHGYRESRYLGLQSGLETGPKTDGKKSPHDLTAASAFVDYFPDVETSVVVLSSCHAGEVSSIADEPVGLPTALLTGGAKAVIAPMWKVDEFATVAFMDYFYGQLDRVETVAEAIQRAQQSLRNLTRDDLLQKIERIIATSGSYKRKIESYRDFIANNFATHAHPYSDPYYWSSFTLIGCDVQLKQSKRL